MKFQTLSGRTRTVSHARKYSIDWGSASKSKLQKRVKDFLSSIWRAHVVFEEFPVAGTKMTFDFFNASKKIIVEVQGGQHKRYTPFFHSNNKANFISQLRRDKDKMRFCDINSLKFIEVYEEDDLSPNLFLQ